MQQVTKICNRCGKEKPLTDFYVKRKGLKCKQCNIELSMRYAKLNRDEFIYKEPNKYNSEKQRKETFEMMELLGYRYNQETGIWYKKPFKSETGELDFTIKYRKMRKNNESKTLE